mmetsp:Transcript_17916/g.60456  ORF Transcript_17916/g.60456 Transcript_17916/m.60456 type:complete len:257 (+) Transcript_17916:1033-1803(+)
MPLGRAARRSAGPGAAARRNSARWPSSPRGRLRRAAVETGPASAVAWGGREGRRAFGASGLKGNGRGIANAPRATRGHPATAARRTSAAAASTLERGLVPRPWPRWPPLGRLGRRSRKSHQSCLQSRHQIHRCRSRRRRIRAPAARFRTRADRSEPRPQPSRRPFAVRPRGMRPPLSDESAQQPRASAKCSTRAAKHVHARAERPAPSFPRRGPPTFSHCLLVQQIRATSPAPAEARPIPPGPNPAASAAAAAPPR